MCSKPTSINWNRSIFFILFQWSIIQKLEALAPAPPTNTPALAALTLEEKAKEEEEEETGGEGARGLRTSPEQVW